MYWRVCVDNRANDCGSTVSFVLMGESLRSSHGPFFQRLFAKKSTPASVRGPLGLHLKAGFTLDTTAFRLLEDNLLVELPGEAYTIAATGQIDLGAVAGFTVTTPAAMSFCKLILLAGRISMISMILSSLSTSKAMVSAVKTLAFGNQPSEYWCPDI